MDYTEYNREFEVKVMDMLGFCNCANPSFVISQIHDYLKKRENPVDTSNEELLLAYVCDKAGLTEHGSSVYGAWISEKGRELVKEMENNEFKEDDGTEN